MKHFLKHSLWIYFMSGLMLSVGVMVGMAYEGPPPVWGWWIVALIAALAIGLVVTINVAEWADICERKAKEDLKQHP